MTVSRRVPCPHPTCDGALVAINTHLPVVLEQRFVNGVWQHSYTDHGLETYWVHCERGHDHVYDETDDPSRTAAIVDLNSHWADVPRAGGP